MTQMNLTNNTEVDDILNIRKVLTAARAKLAYADFGQEDVIAERSGTTVKWFSVGDMDEITAVLGDDPTAKKNSPAITTVTGALALYGNDVEMVENLKITSVIDLPPVIMERMAYNAGKSINALVRNTILAAATVSVANGKTTANITTADYGRYTDIISIATDMENADVPKFTHPKTGEEVYVSLISPKFKGRMIQDATVQALIQAQKADYAFRGELVTIHGVCFVVTSTAATVTLNTDVVCDQTLILGREAYGVSALPLSGGAGSYGQPTTAQPNNDGWTADKVRSMFSVVIGQPTPGPADPYGIKTTIAWKAYFVCKALNTAWMYKYVSAR